MQSPAAARSLFLAACTCLAQSTFDVASVKPSAHPVGRDAGSQVVFGRAGVAGRNVTLKQLIVAAYRVQPDQVFGAPGWLDVNEYDVEAKANAPAPQDQLARMLQTLLAARFRLAAHTETRELRVYDMVVAKGGPKIHAAKDAQTPAAPSGFRGDLGQFANLLSIKLSIPVIDDPTRPSIASSPPVPVIDKTGLTGVYNFPLDVKPEPGGDAFTLWQRVLQDQLGLLLETQKENVEVIVVDHAERAATAN